MPTVNTDDLLSPSEAAVIIGVSKRRVNQLCSEGKLGFRVGKLFFIEHKQAKAFKPTPPGRPRNPSKNGDKNGSKKSR